jgi:CheY-like chemotaxis protein
MTASNVADQLGISKRHLRREQLIALDALAYALKKRYTLSLSRINAPDTVNTEVTSQASAAISEELAWLNKPVQDQSTALSPALTAVINLMQALSKQYHTTIKLANSDDDINLAVHPVGFNQIIINILSVAIAWLSSSEVSIEVEPTDNTIDIHIDGKRFYSALRTLTQQEQASLKLAQQLAEMVSGYLKYTADEKIFAATLSLPAYKRIIVLVIDDNADTIKLLQHFTNGTRYRLIGTQDPDQVVDLVELHHPHLIVLDVMMPQVDGWQLLGQLLQHPSTCDIPIIVSTILGQKELAYSLGASGFAQKPLTQENFIAVLDEQIRHIK